MTLPSPSAERGFKDAPLSARDASQLARTLQRTSPILGVLAFVLGCLGILGWAYDVEALISIAPGAVAMRANTAVGLTLGGAALSFAGALPSRPRRATFVLGGLILSLGLLTLLEYACGRSFGLDLLFFPRAQAELEGAHPGRMSPHSAIVFTLLGAAFLAGELRTRGRHRPADALALLALLGAGLALLGCLYGAEPFYMGGGDRVGMAPHSAAGCVLLALGLLFGRPEGAFMRLFTSESVGGVMARRLLPVSLFVPFFLGLVLLSVAPLFALTDLHVGAAVLVALTMVAFAVLVYVTARTLDHTDSQRIAAETEAALERARGEDERAAAATEREGLVGDLRRALAIRDEFLSIAAHELRTPLSALALQLEGLRRGLVKQGNLADPARSLQKIQTAVRQTERLSTLVQSLLDVSRIGTSRLALDVEDVDMTALVHEVAERMADEAARHGSALRVRAQPDVAAPCDRARVEQALVSLLANAVKYGAGHPVEVELSGTADDVKVRVVDHGIGIGEQDLGRIFEVFERAVSAQHYGGLGLGLYITKRIVEAHDGAIEVESRPGDGAAFTIRLPRRPRPAPRD